MYNSARKLYFLLVYLFLYIPIAILIIYSFNQSAYGVIWTGFTFDWYKSLIGNEQLIDAAVNSLIVASVSSTSATIIGTISALAFYRYSFRGKNFMFMLVYVLIMSPDIVMGISLLVLFLFLHIETGAFTLIVSHVLFSIPFVIITVFARFEDFDNNIIEAAKDLGAGESAVVWRIIFPLILPAIISGWLLSFTLSLDDVVISFFVTSPDFEIMPLRIFSMVRLGVKPEINALCALLFILSIVIVSISQFLIRRKK